MSDVLCQGPYGFSISLHHVTEVGDDASYRLRNSPCGQTNREHIIQDGDELTIKGDLVGVVHGTLTPGGTPATLIVFQFAFTGTQGKRRFRKVDVVVRFANGEEDFGGEDDPEVRAIAPEGVFDFGKSTRMEVTTGLHANASASFGAAGDIGGGIGVGVGVQHTASTEKWGQAKIYGMKRLEGRRWGSHNTAKWTLEENTISAEGVPTQLRSAVLLVPKTNNSFRADIEVDAKVDWLYKAERGVQRMLGQRTVDPVIFDQDSDFIGPVVEGVNKDNLSKCAMKQFYSVKGTELIN